MQSGRAMWGWLLKGADGRPNKGWRGVGLSCHFLGRRSRPGCLGLVSMHISARLLDMAVPWYLVPGCGAVGVGGPWPSTEEPEKSIV